SDRVLGRRPLVDDGFRWIEPASAHEVCTAVRLRLRALVVTGWLAHSVRAARRRRRCAEALCAGPRNRADSTSDSRGGWSRHSRMEARDAYRFAPAHPGPA